MGIGYAGPFDTGVEPLEVDMNHVGEVCVDAVERLKRYGFTDEIGHSLHDCVDFQEIIKERDSLRAKVKNKDRVVNDLGREIFTVEQILAKALGGYVVLGPEVGGDGTEVVVLEELDQLAQKVADALTEERAKVEALKDWGTALNANLNELTDLARDSNAITVATDRILQSMKDRAQLTIQAEARARELGAL